MPYTITQFRSEISKQKNLARPNLFEVNVTGKAINNALVPFMAKIATIPPSTMGVVEVPYFGRQVKVPGNRTFDNLSITILNVILRYKETLEEYPIVRHLVPLLEEYNLEMEESLDYVKRVHK